MSTTLYRKDSDLSTVESNLQGEKNLAYHIERADGPEAITEEDEGDNDGEAAYKASQNMAAITPAQNKVRVYKIHNVFKPGLKTDGPTRSPSQAILRRIDFLLLPLFLVTQTIQYLDKTALNYAKVFGMDDAMHLVGNQYSMAASMFCESRNIHRPSVSATRWRRQLSLWHKIDII